MQNGSPEPKERDEWREDIPLICHISSCHMVCQNRKSNQIIRCLKAACSVPLPLGKV